MADQPKEPTKAELAEALLQATQLNKSLSARVEALETKPAVSSDAIQLRILETLERMELRSNGPRSEHYFGPEIKKTAYDGWVKATDVFMDNVLFQDGEFHPVRREKGEVFQIEKDQLWTDDPFVPVIVKSRDSAGVAITEEHPDIETLRANFRFRRHASVTEDATLRPASSY